MSVPSSHAVPVLGYLLRWEFSAESHFLSLTLVLAQWQRIQGEVYETITSMGVCGIQGLNLKALQQEMSLQLTQGRRLLYSLSLLFMRTLWVPPRTHRNVVAVSH